MDQALFDEWLLSREKDGATLSNGSIEVYGAMWRSLCRELSVGSNPDPQSILNALERLKLAPSPRRRYLQLLAHVLGEDSHARRLLDELPPPARGLPAVMNLTDETTLQSGISRLKLRDRALTLLFLGAGLRTGESVRLRKEDLHLEDPVPWVHARTPRGAPSRVVPLNPAAAGALKDWAASHDKAVVFPGRGAEVLSARAAWRICQIAVEELLGHPGSGTPRSMRHAFAVRNLSAGTSTRLVGEWLGHHEAASTERLKLLIRPTQQPV